MKSSVWAMVEVQVRMSIQQLELAQGKVLVKDINLVLVNFK